MQTLLFQILNISFGIVYCNLCGLSFYIYLIFFLFKLIFIIFEDPKENHLWVTGVSLQNILFIIIIIIQKDQRTTDCLTLYSD